MMRKRKKRPGSQWAAGVLTAVLASGLAAGVAECADQKGSALIAGTVFRDSGFSLPRAAVSVRGLERGKKKDWKAMADGRGEFFVRVPAGPAEYNVVVTAEGYRTYEKMVKVGADERIELSVILEPEPAKR
jgi:hypothetical protein